jgi:uncharacterized membrane protein
MPRDLPSERHSWLLRRRSVMNQRQLGRLFVLLCLPSLLVAAAFLWWGYWYMLAYAVLELTVLAACLRHHARHAADFDRIDISPAVLVVEQRRARRHHRVLLNPCTARLHLPQRERDPLRLAAPEADIVVAEFLSAAQKRQLASELSAHLKFHDPHHRFF